MPMKPSVRRWPLVAAWIALGLLLVLALPLFIRMPPWLDITLFDLAARKVLRGGVLYRDVWDTNLPGMVWLFMAIRPTLGYSSEAIRLVDLGVVASVIFLLVQWLRAFNSAPAARVALALVLATFYLSTPEICHCQRDVWMMLPGLGALNLRLRQLDQLADSAGSRHRLLARGMAEGICWGVAFWIKPYVAVAALASWLAATLLTLRAPRRPAKLVVWDAASVLLGGMIVGAIGIMTMVASRCWSPFLDILTTWDRDYVAHSQAISLGYRIRSLFGHFQVWDLIHLAAVPLAVVTITVELIFAGRERKKNVALVMLASFYLGWLAQAVFLQQVQEYAQVPPLLLGLTFVAAWIGSARRSFPGLALTIGAALFLLAAVSRHPLLRAERLALWPRCWREASTGELRNRLSLVRAVHAPDWEQLQEVATYLRGLGLEDGQLTCYNDSTHSLYLTLDLEPSTPFVHFDLLLECFPGRIEEIRAALAQSPEKYVVSDLQAVVHDRERALAAVPGQPCALPPAFPPAYLNVFPWTEPIVFRAGRYVVQRVTGDIAPLLPRKGSVSSAGRGSSMGYDSNRAGVERHDWNRTPQQVIE